MAGGVNIDADGNWTFVGDAAPTAHVRKPSAVSKGGFNLRMEGLEELIAGLELGAREIASVWRDIMRGPFGNEFLQELKARTSDARRTGAIVRALKVADDGTDGVAIGIPQSAAPHPASISKKTGKANASLYSVGVWLESGTRMHMIPTKVTPYNHLSFGGRVVSRVAHPGTKAIRPMYRTLQLYRRDFANLFVRELDRRLAARMGAR